MNVLFVIHTPKDPQTAVYNSYRRLAAFLEEEGHGAAILAPEDFPGLRRRHARWFPVLYPFWVACWLMRRGERYDLTVFHSYAGWVVNLLRRLVPVYRRLRTVTAFHGLEPLYYNELEKEMELAGQPLRHRFRLIHGALVPWLLRLSCRRSDWIMCLNREEATYLARNDWGHGSRISAVPHGVSHDFFTPRQYASEVHRLLFVAQWREMKGIRYLLEAFSMLAREAPQLELWCVGTLIEEEKVLASFPEEIQNQVVVRPRVEQEELVAVYRDVDVFVFPTIYDGFGMALLEAMASALPVVATPTGAALTLLQAGVNGLIVPKRDGVALADSIRRLLNDKTLREQLGLKAQAVAAQHALEHVHTTIVSLFESILVTRQPRNEG